MSRILVSCSLFPTFFTTAMSALADIESQPTQRPTVPICSYDMKAFCDFDPGCEWTGETTSGVCTKKLGIVICDFYYEERYCNISHECKWDGNLGLCEPESLHYKRLEGPMKKLFKVKSKRHRDLGGHQPEMRRSLRPPDTILSMTNWVELSPDSDDDGDQEQSHLPAPINTEGGPGEAPQEDLLQHWQ